MNNTIDKINLIRTKMKEDGVTYYLVDTADPHLSEYIADYYKEREYLSGFTGSNGLLIIGLDTAYLWTDGRYFVQAENELKDSFIELMRMGQKGVPTVAQFLEKNISEHDVLAVNGYLISARLGSNIKEIIDNKNATFLTDKDYCQLIWTDRPADSATQVYILDDNVTGKNSADKLALIREKTIEKKANALFISKLDDIMWLYNIRANDIECNPVAYSYTLIKNDTAIIYLKKEALTNKVIEYFNKLNVLVKEYDDVSGTFSFLSKEDSILLDKSTSNYSIYNGFEKCCNIVEGAIPTEYEKAIKNEVEIKNSKECYLKDSVALTKFLIYLKENVSKKTITETDAAEVLDNMRREIPGFIELSFPTISAYGSNAAMMHYEAVKGSTDRDAVLKSEGLYLVDSGGTYMNGTTDVTRTIALGPVTEEMVKHFTLSCVGMLRLQNAIFYKGATGRNLDILARQPLWEIGIDYKCGTGHGVGYILNVHEGPQSIRTLRRVGEEETAFAKGMIVSDEPGVYITGSHGIRCENILLCDDYMSNNDGDFLKFEPLTLVPLDSSIIDKKYMNSKDIEYYNDYHKLVYESLAPYMSDMELKQLEEMTKEI